MISMNVCWIICLQLKKKEHNFDELLHDFDECMLDGLPLKSKPNRNYTT